MLVAAVVGRGAFYDVTLAAVVAALALSANTSFADFPRLCRILAGDGWVPEPFEHRGRRLAFSYGIALLAVLAGALLVAFGGLTDGLIPLFAVGALIAFTMSQAGMVQHWRKAGRERGHRVKLAVNAAGAVATAATVIVVFVSKFTEGAWISALLICLTIAGFYAVRRHARALERRTASHAPLSLDPERPIVVVPLRCWNQLTREALRF